MVPEKFQNAYIPVKFFLVSFRALCDGNSGIRHLEEYLQSRLIVVSDWKVIWIGACTLLRTAIDLFNVDAKSCIAKSLREEVRSEWKSIESNKDDHPIFWEFLRKERNNILHEYEWPAYEVWMDQDGMTQPRTFSLLSIKPEDSNTVLVMKDGPYKGRNSLELLKESAEWVEARIFAAIGRAGFDPDEPRNLFSFGKPSTEPKIKSLLG